MRSAGQELSPLAAGFISYQHQPHEADLEISSPADGLIEHQHQQHSAGHLAVDSPAGSLRDCRFQPQKSQPRDWGVRSISQELNPYAASFISCRPTGQKLGLSADSPGDNQVNKSLNRQFWTDNLRD